MWVILEGLDRTGKSSVAELYKRQGFEVVHMSAPDKKYSQPGYAGPSYLDEVLDIYMKYTGKDVLFDRSPYGECVWPFVYNRKAQLDEEDIEVLQDMENGNEVERILMYDQNTEAHWKRCVDNNEPLTRGQFNQANIYFDKMGRKYSFVKKQLNDFVDLQKSILGIEPTGIEQKATAVANMIEAAVEIAGLVNDTKSSDTSKSKEQLKLEKANAINEILSKKIIKQKGEMFEQLEKDIRDFLNSKLSTIFGEDKNNKFSDEEVQVLKLYVKQLKQKLEAKK